MAGKDKGHADGNANQRKTGVWPRRIWAIAAEECGMKARAVRSSAFQWIAGTLDGR